MNCIGCGKPILVKLFVQGVVVNFCSNTCRNNYPYPKPEHPKQESNIDVEVIK